MRCLDPYKMGKAEYGCGRCDPCLYARRRRWAARLLLEARLHRSSYFVTLTYDNEHLPSDGSVDVRVAQLFIKRLRERIAPSRLRYFIVGEYGEVSERPHYHAVLFGDFDRSHVGAAWDAGFVSVGAVEEGSAMYVVSYVLKVRSRLPDGRSPEFARMSLRPGLGAGAVDQINSAKHIRLTGDVPAVWRTEGKRLPFGRYLRGRMRVSHDMEKGEPWHVGYNRRQIEEYDPVKRESERTFARYKVAHLRGIVRGKL